MSPKMWFRLLGLSFLLLVVGFVVPALTQDAKTKGKKYALLVGVTDYKGDKFNTLNYTENDVEKLADVLIAAGFDRVRVLTNKRGKSKAENAPTAANIKKAIDELVEDKGKRDTVLIGFAGHGANVSVDDPDEKGKPKTYSFFCPHDASLLGVSYSTGRSKFLVNLKLDLFDKLENCGARNKFVLVDACRNEFKAESATRSLGVDKETIPGGVGVMFSCSKDEVAWESSKLKHGVFFHFVLEGLRGEAKNKDGEVTWPDLVAYATRQVERQVSTIVGDGASQTPHTLGNVRGAPILIPVGKVVDAPKDKSGKEEIVKGFLDKDGKNSIGMKFVLVKKGKFTMGSSKDDKDAYYDEKPAHEVSITKDFYLGVHEVTQGQYKAVMGSNPSYFSAEGKGADKVKGLNTDDFPVETVSWKDAQDFLDALNALAAEKEKGRVYRLPSEAEWEYACRGGVSSKKYHFGDSISTDDANFFDNKLGRTSKVGSYGANKFGLHDMHGNVWEWCEDWYDDKYYANSPALDPHGPLKDSYRVIRGGSSGSSAENCRSAIRRRFNPVSRDDGLGFRVALVPAR